MWHKCVYHKWRLIEQISLTWMLDEINDFPPSVISRKHILLLSFNDDWDGFIKHRYCSKCGEEQNGILGLYKRFGFEDIYYKNRLGDQRKRKLRQINEIKT